MKLSYSYPKGNFGENQVSEKQASKRTNQSQLCNYDDAGIGFPRDCGETEPEETRHQWNSLDAAQIAQKTTGTFGEDVEFCIRSYIAYSLTLA